MKQTIKRGKTPQAIWILPLLSACLWTSQGYGQGLTDIEKRLLFFPTKNLAATPAKIGLKFDEVSLQTADHAKLHAWWVPRKNACGTLILSHGNGGNISHRLDKLRIFYNLGLNVLLYDYRGYGKSEGTPSETGVYADAQAAYDFAVKEKKTPPDKIIAYGESLGGSVAAHLAGENEVGALILDSSFTSLRDMARVHFPAVAWLTQSKFDTLGSVATISVPVLVLHSTDDEVAPYAQGKKLFETAHEPKQFVELRGNHNEGFLKSKQAYVKGLDSFLKKHFAAPKRSPQTKTRQDSR